MIINKINKCLLTSTSFISFGFFLFLLLWKLIYIENAFHFFRNQGGVYSFFNFLLHFPKLIIGLYFSEFHSQQLTIILETFLLELRHLVNFYCLPTFCQQLLFSPFDWFQVNISLCPWPEIKFTWLYLWMSSIHSQRGFCNFFSCNVFDYFSLFFLNLETAL